LLNEPNGIAFKATFSLAGLALTGKPKMITRIQGWPLIHERREIAQITKSRMNPNVFSNVIGFRKALDFDGEWGGEDAQPERTRHSNVDDEQSDS
jgi:hypothetical protein